MKTSGKNMVLYRAWKMDLISKRARGLQNALGD
jgi:hypothetical protein